MNSVTLIGTVQEPVGDNTFFVAVEHALVPVLVDHEHPPPTTGDRVVIEGALRSGPADLRVLAATVRVLARHMV